MQDAHWFRRGCTIFLQVEIGEELENLKGKREEHKDGIQGVRGELKAHRDKIRAATQVYEIMLQIGVASWDELAPVWRATLRAFCMEWCRNMCGLHVVDTED